MAGGMMEMVGEEAKTVPPHRHTYFNVDDREACAEKALALGGRIHVESTDIPDVGRFTLVQDPTGAHFSAIKFEDMELRRAPLGLDESPESRTA
jgi:predicted enzyme related to lactoylglutathione lyase